MAGQNINCINCETKCKPCHHRDMEIKRWNDVKDGFIQIPVKFAVKLLDSGVLSDSDRIELRGWFRSA